MIRTMAAFGAMMGTVVLGGCSGSNSAPQAPAGASTTTSTPIPNSGEKGEMNTQSKTTTNSAKSTPQTTGNPGKIVKTDAEWKKQLTPEQYRILREKGTEPAFTGKYWNTKTPGNYKCAACGEILFTSNEKFDSHCGWPSFYKALDKSKVEEHVDTSFGMKRTEVVCAKCGGHLGHVFDDAPDMPTGLRYCINSESIVLEKKDESANVENQPDKARK
jgi:peptide-methionine (R)-S-oxide reductase